MINISIDKPTIPDGAGFSHSSTSWQVSLDKSFDENNLIAESLYDTVNLLEFKVFDKLDEDQVVFARVKIHFDNKTETEWSRTITLSENQKGFKLSNTLVVTPNIFIDDSYYDIKEQFINVRTSPFALFAGVGHHKSTSWYIENVDGSTIWSRENDTDNLTSIKLPMLNLKEDKFYVIKVQHTTDTNTSSNYGRQTISTGKIDLPLLIE